MKIELNLPSYEVASQMWNNLQGFPSENRILIAVSKEEKKTDSGLFIPGTTKEGIPRKGVIVSIGHISDENDWYRFTLKVGDVITYGLYAGKEVEPIFKEGYTPPAEYEFSVLSINEIIYLEPNNQ